MSTETQKEHVSEPILSSALFLHVPERVPSEVDQEQPSATSRHMLQAEGFKPPAVIRKTDFTKKIACGISCFFAALDRSKCKLGLTPTGSTVATVSYGLAGSSSADRIPKIKEPFSGPFGDP